MSQSKHSYGTQTPKGTARSRRAQHTNQTKATEDAVEPACRARAVGRGIDRREWREMPYDGRTRTFYEPCKWPECYPDGPPDDETETVIRSCREPTTYHRPRDASGEPCEHETDALDTDADTQIGEDPIESVTDLRKGQLVIWKDRKRPLCVVEATTEPDGTVGLRGPAGGKYVIEGRPEHRQPYYVLGDGYRNEIARVRAENRAEAA